MLYIDMLEIVVSNIGYRKLIVLVSKNSKISEYRLNKMKNIEISVKIGKLSDIGKKYEKYQISENLKIIGLSVKKIKCPKPIFPLKITIDR